MVSFNVHCKSVNLDLRQSGQNFQQYMFIILEHLTFSDLLKEGLVSINVNTKSNNVI